MTTTATIVVRYWPKEKGYSTQAVRPLTGAEYMGLIGWSTSMWTSKMSEKTKTKTGLCAHLSDNAFSGFALFPIITVALVLSGLGPANFSTLGPPEATTPDAEESQHRSYGDDSQR